MGVEIAPGLEVPDSELEFEFVRSPGPGGQNVNKVASALQLRFDVARSTLLDDWSRARLAALAGRRLNRDGWLVLVAHRHRTQEGNRRDALERLAELILQARVRPKQRRPTKPTRASKERRIEGKKARTRLKALRGRVERES